MNMFDGVCGRIAPGLCRLNAGGGIAVKTSGGYRSYDPATGRLTNCDGFVVDVGEDFFFVIPTNRVKPGDIILVGGKPRCVTAATQKTITAINFEDATVETLLPEHRLFMGNSYLYGKIVSLFGANGAKGRKGAGRMIRYMLLSGMLKGRDGGMGGLIPLMLMGGRMNFETDFMDDLFEDGDTEGKDGTKEEEA